MMAESQGPSPYRPPGVDYQVNYPENYLKEQKIDFGSMSIDKQSLMAPYQMLIDGLATGDQYIEDYLKLEWDKTKEKMRTDELLRKQEIEKEYWAQRAKLDVKARALENANENGRNIDIPTIRYDPNEDWMDDLRLRF
jgi:hypothetical protein